MAAVFAAAVFAGCAILPASAVRPPIIGQNSAVKVRMAMTPREMLHQKWEESHGIDGVFPEHRGRDQHMEGPRGIILWSLGRSGTSAFWDSMDLWTRQLGVRLHLVCGKKEGFLAEKASRLRLHR